MIKIFLPYHYVLITLIGFTAILLLSGFSYKKIAVNSLQKSPSKVSFYDLKAMSIDNEEISFEQFKGKKVLIVNVATKCGYTYQYEGMQKLTDLYGEKVAVLGFPANDFLFQESGSNESIAEFCETVFGVTFQMLFNNIIRKKISKKWTLKEKEKQYIKRGRYAEFNLLYDRGTKFGLQTGGNVEGILMSLPPIAKWK